MKSEIYFFEIYTRNPTTGEPGWEIEVGFASADSREEAVRKIAKHFGWSFAEIIQCYRSVRHELGCKTTIIQ